MIDKDNFIAQIKKYLDDEAICHRTHIEEEKNKITSVILTKNFTITFEQIQNFIIDVKNMTDVNYIECSKHMDSLVEIYNENNKFQM